MARNKMMNRLRKERIQITQMDVESDYFAYGYDNEVFISNKANLDSLESQFSLAHELGHAYQFQNASYFKKQANVFCRSELKESGWLYSFIFSLFLLWIELDAWVKGYRILKEENIRTKGYIRYAWSCYRSYLKVEAKRALKYIIFFYPLVLLLGYFTTDTIDWNTFWQDSMIVSLFFLTCLEVTNTGIAWYESRQMKKENAHSHS